MKKIFLKLLCAVLSAAVMLVAFAACVDNDNGGKTVTAEEESQKLLGDFSESISSAMTANGKVGGSFSAYIQINKIAQGNEVTENVRILLDMTAIEFGAAGLRFRGEARLPSEMTESGVTYLSMPMYSDGEYLYYSEGEGESAYKVKTLLPDITSIIGGGTTEMMPVSAVKPGAQLESQATALAMMQIIGGLMSRVDLSGYTVNRTTSNGETVIKYSIDSAWIRGVIDSAKTTVTDVLSELVTKAKAGELTKDGTDEYSVYAQSLYAIAVMSGEQFTFDAFVAEMADMQSSELDAVKQSISQAFNAIKTEIPDGLSFSVSLTAKNGVLTGLGAAFKGTIPDAVPSYNNSGEATYEDLELDIELGVKFEIKSVTVVPFDNLDEYIDESADPMQIAA